DGELHNTSWEDNLVARRGVVSINSRRRHVPLGTVSWLSKLLPLAFGLEFADGNGILEKFVRLNGNRSIVPGQVLARNWIIYRIISYSFRALGSEMFMPLSGYPTF